MQHLCGLALGTVAVEPQLDQLTVLLRERAEHLFQTDALGAAVINADAEFLSGVGAVFVFQKTAVVIVVKIQAADEVAAIRCVGCNARSSRGRPERSAPTAGF